MIHYDFGDCVRSACNPAGEEATDLSEVFVDVDSFAALVKGYLKQARSFLTEWDQKYLYDSVRLIAFELGLRFFTDYLAGDVYFKTNYKGQNLNRARVQMKLCESIETRESILRRVLDAGCWVLGAGCWILDAGGWGTEKLALAKAPRTQRPQDEFWVFYADSGNSGPE